MRRGLSLVEAGFFEQPGIELHIGDRAASLDREKKQLVSQKGVTLDYDICVFATGSYPFVPPSTATTPKGASSTAPSTTSSPSRLGQERQGGAVIGGGLLGLEAANALLRSVSRPTSSNSRRASCPCRSTTRGAALRRRIEALGSRFTPAERDATIRRRRRNKVQSLIFADGSELPVDMVVFSAGIRARDDLARAAGSRSAPAGGSWSTMRAARPTRTSTPSANAPWRKGRSGGSLRPATRWPTWSPTASWADRASSEGRSSAKLKLLGVEVASFGDAHGRTAGAQDIVYNDLVTNVYKKLVLSADAKHVLGGILIGDASSYGSLVQMMLNRMPVPEKPEDLDPPARAGGRAHRHSASGPCPTPPSSALATT